MAHCKMLLLILRNYLSELNHLVLDNFTMIFCLKRSKFEYFSFFSYFSSTIDFFKKRLRGFSTFIFFEKIKLHQFFIQLINH